MNDPQLMDSLFNRLAILQILCVALTIFLIGVLVLFALFYASNRKHQRELLELGRYSTNVQAIIDDHIPEILEAVINDCFRDYRIMRLEYREELYITDEREQEIRDDLIKIVSDRISPMSLDKIGLFYNVHAIDKILADKIYILVMNYVVEHNAVIQEGASTSTGNEQNKALRI